MNKKKKINKQGLSIAKNNVPTKAEAKKGGSGKWILLGLGVAATGSLAFFGYKHWRKTKKTKETELPDTTESSNDTTTYQAPPKPKYVKPKEPIVKDAFPLTKGSKGANVKAFQDALIAKHGKTILPKYGADGDFGSEMLAALTKLNLGTSVTETTFNLYVKGASPDHKATAKDLYNAAVSKDFNKAISLLKTLRNVEDYKTVSDTFVNYRIGAVRQTLVNGMLNSFADAKQKDAIRLAFSNMGLKYDGNKWALSGIDKKYLMTLQATSVWKNPKTPIRVPANMVLGRYITARGEYSLFENEQHYFLVETQHVKQID